MGHIWGLSLSTDRNNIFLALEFPVENTNLSIEEYSFL